MSGRLACGLLTTATVALLSCRGILGLDFHLCDDDCDASAGYDAAPADAPAADGAGSQGKAQPLYRINCGGPAVGAFADDIPNCAYCGGPNGTSRYSVDAAIDLSLVDSGTPMAVYQDYRYNTYDASSPLGQYFSYRFPSLTAGQTYQVRLHFADIFNDAAGRRQFNVDINGTGVLFDFDIIKQAGAPFKAIDQSFVAQADDGGVVEVDLIATNSGDSVACINGIELWTTP